MKSVYFDLMGAGARCTRKLSVGKGFSLGMLDAPTRAVGPASDGRGRVPHSVGGKCEECNGLTAYDVYPNTIQLDQLTLYIQRTADEVQTDHFDWGFRIANLFGQDYKYTFIHDYLSDQYIRAHNKYGYDPVMVYTDLYFPWIAEGMNLRMGRYISIPDIEAQLAPDNLMASHSLIYSPDPYTQTGIVDTIRWNNNWTTQIEFSGGNDVASWDTRNVKPTPAFCVQWTSNSGNDITVFYSRSYLALRLPNIAGLK